MTAASQLCWADPGQGREMTWSLVLCKLQWYSCKQGWPRTQFPWLRGGRLGDPFPGNPPSCQWPVAPAEAARSPEQRAWWKAAALRALELQLEGHGSALLKKCRLSPRKATRLRANSLDEADVFSDPSHGISRLQSFQRGLAMTLLDWTVPPGLYIPHFRYSPLTWFYPFALYPRFFLIVCCVLEVSFSMRTCLQISLAPSWSYRLHVKVKGCTKASIAPVLPLSREDASNENHCAVSHRRLLGAA